LHITREANAAASRTNRDAVESLERLDYKRQFG